MHSGKKFPVFWGVSPDYNLVKRKPTSFIITNGSLHMIRPKDEVLQAREGIAIIIQVNFCLSQLANFLGQNLGHQVTTF